MADEKKLPAEQLEKYEVSLDDVDNVTGGQGPVVHGTGDITDPEKNKS